MTSLCFPDTKKLLVEDAISGVTLETTKSALEEMLEAGAKFVKTSDVLEGKVI